MQDRNQKETDVFLLFVFIWRWKKIIFGTGFFAAVLAAIFFSPLFTEPEYESEAVVFATRNNSSEKQMNDMEYGNDMDADRLTQILQSTAIQDTVVKIFSLPAHYCIDTTTPKGKTKFSKAYAEHISFERTRYLSISIKVTDKEPRFAADVANRIPQIADNYRSFFLKKNLREELAVAEKEYLQKFSVMAALRDTLENIRKSNTQNTQSKLLNHLNEKKSDLSVYAARIDAIRKKYGIYDYGEQVNILNRQIANAEAVYELEDGKLSVLAKSYSDKDTVVINSRARREGAAQLLKSLRKNLVEVSGVNTEYTNLTEKLSTEQKILNDVQPEYEKLKFSFEPVITSSQYQQLLTSYNFELASLNELQLRYEKAKRISNQHIAGIYVVSPAKPVYQKKYPKIFIFSLLAFLSASMASVVVISISQKLKELSERANNTRPEELEKQSGPNPKIRMGNDN